MNTIEEEFYTLLSMDLEITPEYAYETSIALSDKLDPSLSLYLCGFELIESNTIKEREESIADRKHKKLIKYNKKNKLDIPDHPGYPSFYLSEVKKLGVEVRRDHDFDFYPCLEIKPIISKVAMELELVTHSNLEYTISNLLFDYIEPKRVNFHDIMMNMAEFIYELISNKELSRKVLGDDNANMNNCEWYSKCYEEVLSLLASRNGKIPVETSFTKKMFLDAITE